MNPAPSTMFYNVYPLKIERKIFGSVLLGKYKSSSNHKEGAG